MPGGKSGCAPKPMVRLVIAVPAGTPGKPLLVKATTLRAYELSGRRMMPRVRFAALIARCTTASACAAESVPALGPARYSLSAQWLMTAAGTEYVPAVVPGEVP